MIGLLILIFGLIASGFYIANPTGYTITTQCRSFNEPYIVLEPYKVRETYIQWGELYLNVSPKKNIFVPADEPVFINYTICANCKYNITFGSDKPTNYFILDEYNKIRFESNKPSFIIFSRWEKTNENFTFESDTEETYYFVFDRSFQESKTAESSATGTLRIEELNGIKRTIERIEYREVTKYRTVTKCD